MNDVHQVKSNSWVKKYIDRWSLFADEYPTEAQAIVMTVVLAVITLIITAIAPRFLAPSNLRVIISHTAAYWVLGMAMTLVITTAGIDISVGAQMGLIVVVTGMALNRWGFSVPVAMGVALVTGALTGAFNSVFICLFKVPPIIVTLGGFSFFRGIAYVIIRHEILFNFPPAFLAIARSRIFGLPPSVYLGLVWIGVGCYLLNHTAVGRHITAVGGNEEAAQMAGISSAKVKCLVYTLMGISVGMASIIWMGRMNAAQAQIGYGLEMHVIATVVIGGTSLFGGRGLMVGTFIGALFLGVLENGLLVIGLPWFVQQVVLGAIFIGVVVFWTNRERKDAKN